MDRRLAEGLDHEVLVGRSLVRSAIRLLRLPSAMRAASSLPSRLARSARVCIAQVVKMPPLGALVEDLDQRLVDDVRDLVDEERDAPVAAQVVAHAGARRLVGQRQGADGRGDGRVGQRVQAHVEHMAGALDLLEVHDGPPVVRRRGRARGCAPGRPRSASTGWAAGWR